MNNKIRIIEFFGGIGACTRAIERLKIPHEVVDYVEINSDAVKSYNAVHNTNFVPQDITKWDKDFKDIDLIMHGSPCFVGDTQVLTSKGYVAIKNIKLNDEVLTHENTFKSVIDIGSDGEKRVFKVESDGTLPIECTENHPFLVKHKSKLWNNTTYRYDTIYHTPEKVRLFNMRPNKDYIGVPIINDNETNYSDVSNEILWLLGRYVAGGYLSKEKQQLFLVIRDTETNLFNVSQTTYKVERVTDSYSRFVFDSNTTFYKIVNSGIFGFELNNRVIPLEFLQLSKDKLFYFIKGLMSDNSCNKEIFGTHTITTASRQFAEGLVLAIQKVYRVGCKILYKKHKNVYTVQFKLNPRKVNYLAEANCIWYPVKRITDLHLNKKIYNITVEETHTYTANNCYVYNCQDFSLAGAQAGGDEGSGTRSSLMYETIRIINKIKPKYVVWENVKNLLSQKHKHNFDKYHQILRELGYNNYSQVLNSKDFGVPQNRERIFTVSIRQDIDDGSFVFPYKQPLNIRLKDVLENNVEEKYYISDKFLNYLMGTNYSNDKFDRKSVFLAHLKDPENDLASTLTTACGNRPTDTFIGNSEIKAQLANESTSDIKKHIIPRMVSVRKYEIDTAALSELLASAKQQSGLSSEYIATKLNLPQTKVEHWFRTDSSFAIPEPEVWFDLKNLLSINTNQFDDAITNFEIKESTYDMNNRVYDAGGIAPTITTKNYTSILENNNSIINPLKGKTDLSWQFEQQVYSENTPIVRTVKAGDGSGNIPKVIVSTNKQGNISESIGVDELGYIKKSENGIQHQSNTVYSTNGVARTLTACDYKMPMLIADNQETVTQKSNTTICLNSKGGRNNQEGLQPSRKDRVYDSNGIAPTIATSDFYNPCYTDKYRIRKLTPLECWRLMGFDDEDFYKAQAVPTSNSQLYKQAGNSIVVNVLEAIFRNLFAKELGITPVGELEYTPMQYTLKPLF